MSSDQSQNRHARDSGEDEHDINELKEGDEVVVKLEGEVVDEMDRHDDLIRIDVDSQKVEVVEDEIVEVRKALRSVDITEVEENTPHGFDPDEAIERWDDGE